MSKKSWKEHLLSSGLPLEQSVIQVFQGLGIDKPKEYKYERINENGIPTIFSIDVHATHMHLEHNLWLEIFCECKYRHDGTRWIFTPDEFGRWPRPKFRDTFMVMDQITGRRSINIDKLDSFSRKYDLCGKGIEIFENDANPKTIEQCIQQLSYASIEQALDALIHQVDDLLGTPTPIFVIVPIIVTTAELWRLNSGVTVEDIRRANELYEVAEQRDIMIIYQEPDNKRSQDTLTKFNKSLSDEQKVKIENKLKGTKWRGYHLFATTFSSKYPSLFVTINYKHFSSAMENLMSFFENPALILEGTPLRKSTLDK